MQRLALAAGWSVVHEVGHAAPVTAILDAPAGLLTADTDGSLYLRDADGVSVRPPITLPSVSMVTPVPGSSRVVVGTGAGVFTLEPSTGERAAVAGFEDGAAVTCGTVAGERVLVGCSDGTLRELHLDAGVDTAGPDTAGPDSPGPDTAGSADAGPGSAGAEVVERFGSAPVALVSCGAEGALGVWLRDGHLGVVGGDGRRSWLAPQQAVVMSITEAQAGYAEALCEALCGAGLRAEADVRNEKIGYKIREQTLQRIPFLLIVGGREAAEGRVTLRHRDGSDLGTLDVEEAIARLQAECQAPDRAARRRDQAARLARLRASASAAEASA